MPYGGSESIIHFAVRATHIGRFRILDLDDRGLRHSQATGNDKLVWIVIIIFTHIIGALIYYIVRRRPRRFAEWQRHAIAQQRPS